MNLLLACLIIAFVLFSGAIASGVAYLWSRAKSLPAVSLPEVLLSVALVAHHRQEAVAALWVFFFPAKEGE